MSNCHREQGITSSNFGFKIYACPTKGQQAKGQQISKQNCGAVTSSKKQTKRTQDTILSALCSFFLGKVTARQFCFEIN